MQSIRFRLAVYYSLALTVTMVAFGAAVYWERTATAPREAVLRLDAALKSESDFAVRVIIQQARALHRGTRTPVDAAGQEGADSLIEAVRPYLDPVAHYVLLASPSGGILYRSPS